MKTLPLSDDFEKDLAVHDHPAERMEPLPESARSELAAALHRVIGWVAVGGTQKTISARLMVLCTALNIDLGTNIITEADIARANKLTRAAVSAMTLELKDTFGLVTHNNRTERTRKRCRKAQQKKQQ